jgi:hypothetical protein
MKGNGGRFEKCLTFLIQGFKSITWAPVYDFLIGLDEGTRLG